MKKNMYVYALYKGDHFIDIGTREYLANLIGVTPKTISFYASPAQIKRNGNNCYICVRIKDDEIK